MNFFKPKNVTTREDLEHVLEIARGAEVLGLQVLPSHIQKFEIEFCKNAFKPDSPWRVYFQFSNDGHSIHHTHTFSIYGKTIEEAITKAKEFVRLLE